ncbi:hypothetical protein BH23VER1_BH23VER1_18720 [soil metagenome]
MKLAPPRGALSGLREGSAARTVACFECGAGLAFPRASDAVACLQCGHPNVFASYQIDRPWDRVICTHGDVVVHAPGEYALAPLRCRNLTVYGCVRSAIVCRGHLALRASATMVGSISAAHLDIGQGTSLTFLRRARAGRATVKGEIAGELDCSGPVVIARGGSFEGALRAAGGLVVEPGGALLAAVRV